MLASVGVAFFHLLSLSFIHSSMKSELKSDLTTFLQYKLATITPHPVSLIHAYPQYIAFKILSFCRNTEQLACQHCKKAHKIPIILYINPQWMLIKKTDFNDVLPPMLFISKSTPTDHKTGLPRNHYSLRLFPPETAARLKFRHARYTHGHNRFTFPQLLVTITSYTSQTVHHKVWPMPGWHKLKTQPNYDFLLCLW
jgi:hypothetical protein